MSAARWRAMAAAGLALGLAAGLSPAAVAAQAGCGPEGRWAGVEVGAVRYAMAGGMDGVEAGVEAGLARGGAVLRAGYRAVALADRRAVPHLVRASASHAVAEAFGVRACVGAHLAGSAVAAHGDRAAVLAGGLGVGLAGSLPVGSAVVTPVLEVRGLAAGSGGTVLDLDVGATGLSLGVEGGVQIRSGRTLVALTGSADGFAAGLGVTPYPAFSARLGVGYRF